MRRIIPVLLSTILLAVAVFLAATYFRSLETNSIAPDARQDRDPATKKYEAILEKTLWACPSLSALKDGRIAEIFVVTGGDPGEIDDGYKWESSDLDRKFEIWKEDQLAVGGIRCSYDKIVYGGDPKMWRSVGHVDVALAPGYIGEVNFELPENVWIYGWPVDADHLSAGCQESRDTCTFAVNKKPPRDSQE